MIFETWPAWFLVTRTTCTNREKVTAKSDVSSRDEEDAISEEEAGLDSDPGMYDSSWVFFWVLRTLSSTNKPFLSGACPGLKERFEAKDYRLCAVRFLEL